MADDRDKLTVTGEEEKPDGRKQDGSGDQEGSRKKKTDKRFSMCVFRTLRGKCLIRKGQQRKEKRLGSHS